MGSILRFLGWRGIAGLAIAAILGVMLAGAKIDARHWKGESGKWQTAFTLEKSAFDTTVANYRNATVQARLADKANVERVAAEQSAINERTANDYEARLADARARAERLRAEAARTAADPGSRGDAPVPGLPAPAGGAGEATCENGLSDALTATCQAIQLDELIKWVTRQHAIDVNKQAGSGSKPPSQ